MIWELKKKTEARAKAKASLKSRSKEPRGIKLGTLEILLPYAVVLLGVKSSLNLFDTTDPCKRVF